MNDEERRRIDSEARWQVTLDNRVSVLETDLKARQEAKTSDNKLIKMGVVSGIVWVVSQIFPGLGEVLKGMFK